MNYKFIKEYLFVGFCIISFCVLFVASFVFFPVTVSIIIISAILLIILHLTIVAVMLINKINK